MLPCPLVCTPEECIDFDIKIGLISECDRQKVIVEFYNNVNEIRNIMINDNN